MDQRTRERIMGYHSSGLTANYIKTKLKKIPLEVIEQTIKEEVENQNDK